MKKLQSYLAFSAGSVVFLLVVFRAVAISFTHDECLSYFMFIKQDWNELFDGGALQTNNHLLNTILAKVFYSCFGNEEWILRLPNILFFIPYLFFNYRILNTFCKNKIIVLPAFLCFCAVPSLLDYFSICRGYGISLGCMMPACYYLLSYLKNNYKPKSLWLGIVFLLPGIAANFAFLFYMLPVLIFILCSVLFFRHKDQTNQSKMIFTLNHILPWILLLIPCIKYGVLIFSSGSLDLFVTKGSLWTEEIDPLIYTLFHGISRTSWIIGDGFRIFTIITFASALMFSAYSFIKTPADFNPGRFFSFTLLFYCVSTMILNSLFKIPFAPPRAVVFHGSAFFSCIYFFP